MHTHIARTTQLDHRRRRILSRDAPVEHAQMAERSCSAGAGDAARGGDSRHALAAGSSTLPLL
eukprot:58026-Chlamydomonas_euryale.AAC.11